MFSLQCLAVQVINKHQMVYQCIKELPALLKGEVENHNVTFMKMLITDKFIETKFNISREILIKQYLDDDILDIFK